MALEQSFMTSGLDHDLLALVKYRVSQINDCAFCLRMHSTDPRRHGESELRLHMLSAWRDSTIYSDRERAALGWAEALTTCPVGPAGGGRVMGGHNIVRGLAKARRPFAGLRRKYPNAPVEVIRFATIDGLPGYVSRGGGDGSRRSISSAIQTNWPTSRRLFRPAELPHGADAGAPAASRVLPPPSPHRPATRPAVPFRHRSHLRLGPPQRRCQG